ncbi:MAG TPA: ABC transporter ATP-binding protein [Devosiaceae bacterium]
MPSTPFLEVRDLSVDFKLDRQRFRAVKASSFQLERGETLGLVGESGSGKSVTARAIMRLLPATAKLAITSEIIFDGQELARLDSESMRKIRGDRISMIFQEPMSSLNPLYTVGDQIAESLVLHQSMSKKMARKRAVELLDEVHIPDPEARARQYPHQLSGGQRQRVMIATAIANNPELLIADEPTTALDVTVQAEILKLLKQLQEKHGMAMIFITHDLGVVQRVCDRVCVMRKGEIVETGPTRSIFAAPEHPYTRQLLASEPSGEPLPVTQDAPELLSAKHMDVRFDLSWGSIWNRHRREIVAVDNVELSLKRGHTVGIVGESGSGKSTLGKALLRLMSDHGGEVTWNGERIDGYSRHEMLPLRPKMQVVFQDPFSSLNPRMSVRQIIEEGLVIHRIGNAGDRLERVRQALADVGLDPDCYNRYPHEFSGGQRQRIAIARVLVLNPDFVLLDEPTSALDLSVQAQIIDLLRALQEKYGLSYLFISHDLKVVRALCHDVIVMRNGKVVESGACSEVLSAPKSDYTRTLIKAAF